MYTSSRFRIVFADLSLWPDYDQYVKAAAQCRNFYFLVPPDSTTLDPGTIETAIVAPGYEEAKVSLTPQKFTSREELEWSVVKLKPKATTGIARISVVVNGKPFREPLRVRFSELGRRGQTQRVIHGNPEAGFYELELPAGKYRMSITGSGPLESLVGRRKDIILDIEANRTQSYCHEIEAGTIRLRSVDKFGNFVPIEQFSLKRLGEFSSQSFRVRSLREAVTYRIEEDGSLLIPLVNPGAYRIDVTKSGVGVGSSSPVDVFAGSIRSVEVTLNAEQD